jgi:hypothetical protein
MVALVSFGAKNLAHGRKFVHNINANPKENKLFFFQTYTNSTHVYNFNELLPRLLGGSLFKVLSTE